ncbi:hypothetical protein LTS18_012494, partial [Coniosporium uncinatum]
MGALPAPPSQLTGPPQLTKTGKRKRDPVTGGVTAAWVALNAASAIPWCNVDHSTTQDMGFRLHKEICDFYDYVRPHSFEQHMRQDLVDRLANFLQSMYSKGQLLCFGSFACGLYLPTADMDLVFVSHEYMDGGYPAFGDRRMMRAIERALVTRRMVKPGSCELIFGAKVPIVKFIDEKTGIKVDISFDKLDGPDATKTFLNWKQQYPAMPIIVTIIKQFLAMRDLSEVFTGGIGGFTITCLVVSLLQLLPSTQSRNMRTEDNLGELLLHFFDHYGSRFNLETTAISMKPPEYFPKAFNKQPNRLCIMDPNRPDNDISQGSSNIAIVFQSFRDAYFNLQKAMTRVRSENPAFRSQSILGSILG